MFSSFPFSGPQYSNGGYGRPAAYCDPYAAYYGNGYSRAQEEQIQRARLAAARRRQLEQERLRQQRQRASVYLPDDYPYGPDSGDEDEPQYDYGLGRAEPCMPPFGLSSRGSAFPSRAAMVCTSDSIRHMSNLPDFEQKTRSPSPPQQQRHSPIPIHTQTTDRKTQYTTTASHSPTPHIPQASVSPQRPLPSLEVQNDAASKIQKALRVHQALNKISKFETQFQDLHRAFTLPELLDFQQSTDPNQIITLNSGSATPLSSPVSGDIPTIAKLAYTPRNRPLLAYIESLNRLLTSLDGVESWGEKNVRERRKQVIRTIEAELQQVEGLEEASLEEQDGNGVEKPAHWGWRGLWRRFAEKVGEPSAPESLASTVPEESARAEVPETIKENVPMPAMDETGQDEEEVEWMIVDDAAKPQEQPDLSPDLPKPAGPPSHDEDSFESI
jgi:hypothetical protein